MNCHLLVPDLFWPAAAGSAPIRDIRVPALETILARGRRTRTAGNSLERWLASAFALPESLPLAPYALHGDGGEPGGDIWMHADPIHLKVHGNHLILADASRLSVTTDESRDFVAALNQQFAPEHITFAAPHPQRWYARMTEQFAASIVPTAEVAGRSIDAFVPAGEDGARWRRTFNETQMLLHAHPRNAAREAAGALPVNSVWLWGAGRAGKPASPYDVVWADYPLASGLAAASGTTRRALPNSAVPLLKEPGGKSALVVADLLPLTAYGDVAAWREALLEFERSWCAPLLAGVAGKKVRNLTLHGLGPDFGYDVEYTRQDQLRLWRRLKPLHAYAP